MTAIFHRMYGLSVKRQRTGTIAQSLMVARHYRRLVAMYGAEHNFRVGR